MNALDRPWGEEDGGNDYINLRWLHRASSQRQIEISRGDMSIRGRGRVVAVSYRTPESFLAEGQGPAVELPEQIWTERPSH